MCGSEPFERWIAIRVLRLVVACAAALASACSAVAPPQLAPVIRGVFKQPFSGAVDRIVVSVPSGTVGADQTFFVKSVHGDTSRWRSTKSQVSGNEATLSLESVTPDRSPNYGEPLVVWYRGSDGHRYVLPKSDLSSSTPPSTEAVISMKFTPRDHVVSMMALGLPLDWVPRVPHVVITTRSGSRSVWRIVTVAGDGNRASVFIVPTRSASKIVAGDEIVVRYRDPKGREHALPTAFVSSFAEASSDGVNTLHVVVARVY